MATFTGTWDGRNEADVRLLVSSLKSAPPLSKSRLRKLVDAARDVTDVLEYNWIDLPDSLRHVIRLGYYSSRQRKPSLWDRMRFTAAALSFGPDFVLWREYVSAISHLDQVLHDLFERDDPRYHARLNDALGDLRPAVGSEKAPESVEDWSAWLRQL